jgi:hypothetical protein
LKPGGRAVLHLPAPDLLKRVLPQHELAALHVTYQVQIGQARRLVLEHRVTGMDYDHERALRSIHVDIALKDSAGNELKREQTALYYACLTASDLRLAAAGSGLVITELHSGFKPGTNTELVVVLELDPRC